MPFKSDLKLDAGIWNSNEREQSFSNVPVKAARRFKDELRQKVLDAPHTGREYSRGGRGFKRRHRASARGERFANDTGETLNSLTATRTGDNSAIVEFKSKTADYLEKIDRVLISDKDQERAGEILAEESAKAVKGLLSK